MKHEKTTPIDGMSLRDHFAGLAMAALIAEPSWGDGCNSTASRLGDCSGSSQGMYASAAYQIADAMLRARKVQP